MAHKSRISSTTFFFSIAVPAIWVMLQRVYAGFKTDGPEAELIKLNGGLSVYSLVFAH